MRYVTITDLIGVIHYTIIKKLGKNEVILKEIQSIQGKISGDKILENYSVEDTEFWKSILKQRDLITDSHSLEYWKKRCELAEKVIGASGLKQDIALLELRDFVVGAAARGLPEEKTIEKINQDLSNESGLIFGEIEEPFKVNGKTWKEFIESITPNYQKAAKAKRDLIEALEAMPKPNVLSFGINEIKALDFLVKEMKPEYMLDFQQSIDEISLHINNLKLLAVITEFKERQDESMQFNKGTKW